MIKTFQTGGNRNLGYLIADDATNKAIVIDPSYDPSAIATYAAESGYTVVYVFNTHDHHDHTNGNQVFEELTGIRALKFEDIDPLTQQSVADGAV